MKVWIDLANSPHVLFFRPLFRRLTERGHECMVTTRNFAQTVPLAEQFALPHCTLGGHGGRRRTSKLSNIAKRAWALARWARSHKPDVAVSHNSYAQVVAAKLIGVPCITFMDYEHTPANHVAFRLANHVVLPEALRGIDLRRFGLTADRTTYYPGLKEDLYLADFQPKPRFRESLRVAEERVLVTLRPPATMALYHNFENPAFEALTRHVAEHDDTSLVMLPRTMDQSATIRAWGLPKVIIPERALDGPNLVYSSDLVIGAGGTMNREAASLGTPAYTIFRGEMAAVDRNLIASGRMIDLTIHPDPAGIQIRRKRCSGQVQFGNPSLLPMFVAIIEQARGIRHKSGVRRIAERVS